MKFLYPNWNVPSHIKAAVTLRYDDLNLSELKLPSEPIWLKQVHGNNVIFADECKSRITPIEADASIANCKDMVCAVRTADCLPILISDVEGKQIAAIHAGWRGQIAGIIEATIKKMQENSNKLLVWLGPAIGPNVYEVGVDVYDQVMNIVPNFRLMEHLFFIKLNKGKFLFDLCALAKFKLQNLGVPDDQIFSCNRCTYTETDLFYSYRRDKTDKRMVSLIWFDL